MPLSGCFAIGRQRDQLGERIRRVLLLLVHHAPILPVFKGCDNRPGVAIDTHGESATMRS